MLSAKTVEAQPSPRIGIKIVSSAIDGMVRITPAVATAAERATGFSQTKIPVPMPITAAMVIEIQTTRTCSPVSSRISSAFLIQNGTTRPKS
ncbi:unannotated protein [freshwater metagenome]|uniref:Unannotated protein n=1 Tax=freshwater metagenome TaxID=449393 RepID=A0A6J6K7N8_9ZZZZ